jgi:hypothetical protein
MSCLNVRSRRGRGHDGERGEVALSRPAFRRCPDASYQGVLFMVNDSGILIAFDPATGNV